jgi:hypothetical protein
MYGITIKNMWKYHDYRFLILSDLGHMKGNMCINIKKQLNTVKVVSNCKTKNDGVFFDPVAALGCCFSIVYV